MQDGKSNVNQGGYVMPKDIQTHRDSIEQVVCDHGMSESILAVATTGSFTEAAKYLRCSKSKVSKLVANAELLLDDKIFARTTRSVHVTEMGIELVTMLQARKDHLRKLLNSHGVRLVNEQVRQDVLDFCRSHSMQAVKQSCAERIKNLSCGQAFNQKTLERLVLFLLQEKYISVAEFRSLLTQLFPGQTLSWLHSLDVNVILANQHQNVAASGLWDATNRLRFLNNLISLLSQ